MPLNPIFVKGNVAYSSEFPGGIPFDLQNGGLINHDSMEMDDEMNRNEIIQIHDQYEKISLKLKERWEKLIGFGCGYFHSWGIMNNKTELWVKYNRPKRFGGGLDGPDIFPIACFEANTTEQAKQILMEFKENNEKNENKQ